MVILREEIIIIMDTTITRGIYHAQATATLHVLAQEIPVIQAVDIAVMAVMRDTQVLRAISVSYS